MLYQTKVKYTKQNEDGSFKRVSEEYLLGAETFTDAEARIYEELGKFIKGEFRILAIKIVNFSGVFIDDDFQELFECSIQYHSVDDNKKQSSKFLISAKGIEDANKRISETLNEYYYSFEIKGIKVSKIVDYSPYENIGNSETNS
jgi:hypothetical protein